MCNKVSIIIPVYQEDLSDYEKISVEQCFAILSNYKIQFVCPKLMEFGKFHTLQKMRADFIFLDDKNFKSIASYNYMLLSVWFYELFNDYKYILIYQLDSFVFQDDLNYWLEKGFSYIGAPWFKEKISNSDEVAFDGVGNGGFSLRKVKDCIRILKSSKKVKTLRDCIFIDHNKFYISTLVNGLNRYFKKHSFKSINMDSRINEDKVFALAGERFKYFKIPSPQIASSFACEMHPDLLFNKNKKQLPFGCHAWFKYDLEFYIPFIEKYGYNIKQR